MTQIKTTKTLADTLRREKRDTARSYAVIAVKWGDLRGFSLLATEGKVMVFDTPAVAKEFTPRLGQGRITHWSKDGETAYWSPVLTDAFNQATILTGYDPYDLPPGSPVPEESGIQDWKHHVMWNVAWSNAFCKKNKDGKLIHEVLGEVQEESFA